MRETRIKLPFTATRQFRVFVIFAVMAVAVASVVVFELRPKLAETERIQREREQSGAFHESVLVPVEERVAAALATVEDGSSIDLVDDGRAALIEYVMRPDTPAPGTLLEINFTDMKSYAGELRGQPIQLLALFLEWHTVALERPVGERAFIERAFLMDPGGEAGYVVDLLEVPQGIEQRDLVEVEANFLKIGQYTTKKDEIREVPQFVGRAIRPAHKPGVMAAVHEAKTFTILVVSTVVGATLLWMLLIHFQRRGEMLRLRAMEESLARTRHARVIAMRPRAASPPPAPATDDAPRPPPPPGKPLVARRPLAPESSRESPRVGPPRLLVSAVLTTLMALLGLTGYQLYRFYFPSRVIITIDSFASLDRDIARAEAAREVIAVIESHATEDPKSLRSEDYRLLAAKLRILEEVAQSVQDRLEEARLAGWREHHERPEGASGRDYGEAILQMKCWIIDVDGLLRMESAPPEFAGIFVPLAGLERDATAAIEEAQRAGAEASPDVATKLQALLARARGLEKWIAGELARDQVPYHAAPDLKPLLALRERLEAAARN